MTLFLDTWNDYLKHGLRTTFQCLLKLYRSQWIELDDLIESFLGFRSLARWFIVAIVSLLTGWWERCGIKHSRLSLSLLKQLATFWWKARQTFTR